MDQADQVGKPRARSLSFLFALFVVVAYTVAARAGLADGESQLDRVVAWALSLFAGGLLVVLPVWIWRRRGESLALPRLGAWRIVREFLIAIPIMFLVFLTVGIFRLVLAILTGDDVAPSAVVRGIEHFEGSNLAVLIFAACVLAPVGEELFFRKFLFEELKPWFGASVAVIIQAAMFGAVHYYEGFPIFAGYMLIAALLMWVYRWRKTLLAPIIVHGLFNGFMIAVILIQAPVPSPYLGVRFDPAADACTIDSVMSGSAAEQAGILAEDVIISFEGKPVSDYKGLTEKIRLRTPGDRIVIELERNGERVTLEAVLGTFERL